ncbi:unnamed protein product [Lactuca virosa]|uniref:Uncharacterized protein n=1 Tax=Lactuca virosa TaxID=75947 RepID=A0AAU9NS74_9ASTR|nr:unnamed protein product [Lactuca virosa]
MFSFIFIRFHSRCHNQPCESRSSIHTSKCKSPRLLCVDFKKKFSIMHTDPKTSKDPQYFVSKNILVESDRYQLGVHSISRVGFVGLSRPLYLTLSHVKWIVFLGKDVSDDNKLLLSQAVDIFHIFIDCNKNASHLLLIPLLEAILFHQW